jgi:hypothetical protein
VLHRPVELADQSGQSFASQNLPLSAITPIATIALVGILPPDQAAPLWRDAQAVAMSAAFRR